MKRLVWMLLAAVLLTGCGRAAEDAGHADNAAVDAGTSGFRVEDGRYFHTEALEADGTFEQIVCFTPEGTELTVSYDQYAAGDERYGFDEQGRLCYYRNADDIFYNRMHGETERLTQEDMRAAVREILRCCGEDRDSFEVLSESYFPATDTTVAYSVMLRRERSEGIADAAEVNLTDDGQLRYLNINYNETPPLTEEEKAGLQEQYQAYLEKMTADGDTIEEQNAPFYIRIEDRLYASYTVVFGDACEEGQEPALYCEEAVFSLPR